MPKNCWVAPTQQYFDGVSVAQNTFTAARDIPVGDATTKFHQVLGGTMEGGAQIRVKGWGVASNTGTPTIILGLYWGGVAGTALVVSAAKTTTTAMSNWPFYFEYQGRVVAGGTAGSIMGLGKWWLPTALTSRTEFAWPETAPALISSLDLTTNKMLTLGATWSASSASNTLTLHAMDVWIGG